MRAAAHPQAQHAGERRGRAEGWDIGKGGAGAAGGETAAALRRSPLCSIARQRARSAASSGHRAWREVEDFYRLTYCSHAAAVHVGVSRGAPPPRPRVRCGTHTRTACAAAGAPGPYGSRVPARQRSSPPGRDVELKSIASTAAHLHQLTAGIDEMRCSHVCAFPRDAALTGAQPQALRVEDAQ